MTRPPLPAELAPVLERMHPHRADLFGRLLADESVSLTDDIASDLDDPDGTATVAVPIPPPDADRVDYGRRLAVTMTALRIVPELLRERGYLVEITACPPPHRMAVAWRVRLIERRAGA